MKKNRTMRLAALLLVLTLITSCFVGGTFAKYTTKVIGDDSARVAKFGVELTTISDVFKVKYDSDTAISVLSTEDVIAPGTTNYATIFTISGTPEVDVQVTVSLGEFTMVTLPNGAYKDWTDLNKTEKYNLASDYKPVKWTLTKDSVAVPGCTNVNLDAINTYLTGTLSGKYEVEGGEGAKVFSDICGDYVLTWNWGFNVDNQADTTLGQIAAGVETAPATGYVANESFDFSIQVDQLD